jgi:hypothetical protein
MNLALVIVAIVLIVGLGALLLGAHLGEALGNSLFPEVQSDAPPTPVVEATS